MRVIAGSARRLLLKTPPGEDTRPTTDRIKETLFNMIQTEVPGARFLDLFSGSGGIAIEALSRGADYAVLVDSAAKACSCIRENLAHTHFEDSSRVMNSDFLSALRRLDAEKEKPFDIIFLDPPYGKGLEDAALRYLASSPLAGQETLFIVETKLDEDIGKFTAAGYRILKNKEYKTNRHVFLRREPA